MSSHQIVHYVDPIIGHRLNKPTILIVDDIEMNRLVLDQCLRNLNCNLEIAANGEEAVSLFRNCNPDVILLDIMMPIMNGFDAAKHIREIEKETGAVLTPIIAISAHIAPHDQHLCLAAGMNDYMSKPVRRSDLIGKLKTWAPHIVAPSGALRTSV